MSILVQCTEKIYFPSWNKNVNIFGETVLFARFVNCQLDKKRKFAKGGLFRYQLSWEFFIYKKLWLFKAAWKQYKVKFGYNEFGC